MLEEPDQEKKNERDGEWKKMQQRKHETFFCYQIDYFSSSGIDARLRQVHTNAHMYLLFQVQLHFFLSLSLLFRYFSS